jgi:hypothetical protein
MQERVREEARTLCMKGLYVGTYQASLSRKYSAAYGCRGQKANRLLLLGQAYLAFRLPPCYQLAKRSSTENRRRNGPLRLMCTLVRAFQRPRPTVSSMSESLVISYVGFSLGDFGVLVRFALAGRRAFCAFFRSAEDVFRMNLVLNPSLPRRTRCTGPRPS